MKGEVKLPVIIVAVIAVVGLAIFLGSKAFGAGDLDQGQVKYTPGKPPWEEKDPSKRGPGGPPSGQLGQVQVQGQAQGLGQQGDVHTPPGMGAPVVGNTPK
jgi:hypothetical protein